MAKGRGDFTDLGARDVGGIIQRGGTILQTARFPDFARPEVQQEALQVGDGPAALTTCESAALVEPTLPASPAYTAVG